MDFDFHFILFFTIIILYSKHQSIFQYVSTYPGFYPRALEFNSYISCVFCQDVYVFFVAVILIGSQGKTGKRLIFLLGQLALENISQCVL